MDTIKQSKLLGDLVKIKRLIMTDYQKELLKNWGNIDYLYKNGYEELVSISNKIKKTASDGPFINYDIAEYIKEIIKNERDLRIVSTDEIKSYIKLV